MWPGESYNIPPQLQAGRAQSELFTFQCSQWELNWNSQLIEIYKEMWPGESYDIPPTLKLAELRVNSSLFNAVNESSFETVN